MSDFPHATFRIEMAPGKRLGPGKIRLLELVGKTGSISAAARAMEMSYRRAWLLIEESNGLFAAPLVESSTGGVGGGGARLTDLGHSVIAAYRAIETEAAALVARRLAKFPGAMVSRSAAIGRRSKRP
ncbi:MAG: LysR family transcriptional regulator [Rhizobiales bacterium]|nr:LysR family transcriptional regulator [Hyphomicrobiales bacterium]